MTSQSLSSEQALDDYFSALLEGSSDETAELTPVEPVVELVPEPQLQPVEESHFVEPELEEVDVPNLEDVERLLKQLEASNPVDEVDVEHILEQNTVSIAQTQPVVEEIQEWDTETLVEETVVEIPTVELNVTPEVIEPEIDIAIDIVPEVETQPQEASEEAWQSIARSERFQVLYFDVNGVLFAVPLDELGGIHRLGELNHLIGRPAWYLGLQTSRDAQLDVVDTAKWVMSEKIKDDAYKDAYEYVVMLGESMWGLASTQLKGTEALEPETVRWREKAGKRPWLAGMVKEKMCALIHVDALIAMLNAGLDVKALDN
ncbi:chemotaxis protein CheW [Vibrio hepatarius]|uniref:chemotaxis protein CheW n=1 Tax=Vibrio hepatarius TaxID=171383 RepID=UPI00142E4EDF|nr:chemotaxis protein CheW [Vibrio hepatarius]NIY84823.1 chemotaxis protein CheW [Vibrio hepatarius]NVJ54895.1 chemotaxis protein CheW [Vibrionaceae bacterium]